MAAEAASLIVIGVEAASWIVIGIVVIAACVWLVGVIVNGLSGLLH
jgi:hypothetical protein